MADGGVTRTYGVRIARSDTLELPRHPDAPVAQSWRAWVEALETPIAVDLFCGAGGLSLGLEEAGCTVVLSVDQDEKSLETHRGNFPGRAIGFDLGDPDRVDDLVSLLSVIDIDILAGGPPCQPFSRAGRSKIRSLVAEGTRPAHDGRRELWKAFLHVALEVRPRAILLENVPDMALGDDASVVRTMMAMLEDAGYEVDFRLLEAWQYGVPQHRQRLIFVAWRDGGSFEWPKPGRRVTIADAIGDLPALGEGYGAREMAYDGPSTAFQRRARKRVPAAQRSVVFDHMTRAVRDDDREAFELMTPESTYSDLPKRLRRYRDDIFNDKYNRLGWDELSRSITAHIAKDGYWYIHPGEARTLTVREAARLQTFPDRFRFAGSRSHAFTQIGNAVPPRLASRVAGALLALLDDDRAVSGGASGARRTAFRDELTNWFAPGDALWLAVGDPWSVFVSTMHGRRGAGDAAARELLRLWPSPDVVPGVDDGEWDGRMRSVVSAARAVVEDGWDADTWEGASGLGPAAITWIRSIGLREGDLVDGAGPSRVACRYTLGADGKTGAESRLLIAQLVGVGDRAVEVTAALAAVADQVCRPSDPRCDQCPLVGECRFAKVS